MRRVVSLGCVVALALLLPVGVFAQVTTAAVQGQVTDESGSPVPGATVAARHVGTGASRSTVSDSSGSYRIAALQVGAYEITASLTGFGTQVRSGLTLRVAQEAEVSFKLKVASVAETITVQGDTPIVETTKTTLGKTITTKQIDDLPIAGRNFTNLAFLTPGILVNASTGGTGIAAGGQTGRSNTFLIDGLSNDDDAVSSTRGEFSIYAIREFQVLSNQFSAEYGQASGAIVNAVTRSGANEIEGRVWFDYRADELAANDPFVQVDPATGKAPKAPFEQKIVGGFLGGRLKKDKTFYFLSYEHTFRDQTSVISVPTAVLSSLGQKTETNYPNAIRNPKVLAKLDHHLSPSQTLTVRYRLDRDTRDNWYIGGTSSFERGTDRLIKNEDFAASHTWVTSPSTLNELRVQYAKRKLDWNVDNYCSKCPTITRPSVLTGKMSNMPQGRTEDRWQLIDTFSFNLLNKGGDHHFKVGVDASLIDLFSVFHNNLDGTFTFSTDRPFNAADRTTYPIQYSKNTGDPSVDLPNTIFGAFIQDQWRITPHFTLSPGLRWDYEDFQGIDDDRNNFAPRLHFAWDPFKDGRTSVRGGLGIYYDQIFLNIPLNVQNAKKFVGVTIANPGFPDPLVGGTVTTPPPPSTVIFDPNLETPYSQTMSLGFQRELFKDMALTLDGVYTRGLHLMLTTNDNYSIFGSPRPDPNFTNKNRVQTRGNSKYKALQVGLDKRFSRRYSFNIAYTLSDSKRDTEDFGFQPVDHRDLAAEWAPSFSDARHTIGGSALVEAPWGFKLGTAGRYRTALPYNVTTGTDDNRDLSVNDRPPGVGRNSARGATVWTVDARLSKVFKIRQSKLEFIASAFNLFNHPSRGAFIGNRRSPQFEKPTAVVTNFEPRQVEVGLRIDF